MYKLNEGLEYIESDDNHKIHQILNKYDILFNNPRSPIYTALKTLG